MKKGSEKLSISINSPVVLGFASISLASLLLGIITQGFTTNLLFSVYRSSFWDPFTYIRFFGHIFGHADWVHFMSNMMLILVVGPLLEEKYGSSNMLFVILATALVTGIANFLFFPYAKLLGASGVVFAFILLSSLTSIKEGSIPLTFILVALIYIGSELYEGAFVRNNISNLTHILGGIIGAVLGYIMNKYKMNKY